MGGRDQETAVSGYISLLSESPGALVFGVGPGNAAFHAYKYLSAATTGDASKGLILSSRFPVLDSVAAIGFIGIILQGYLWSLLWKCPWILIS